MKLCTNYLSLKLKVKTLKKKLGIESSLIRINYSPRVPFASTINSAGVIADVGEKKKVNIYHTELFPAIS